LDNWIYYHEKIVQWRVANSSCQVHKICYIAIETTGFDT